MPASVRSSPLEWLCGIAAGRPVEPGFCSWCGEEIVLVDPTDSRRARRARHRGDVHEEGSRDCHRQHYRAKVWNARALVIFRGDPRCVDCGSSTRPWEAEHEIPLIDGGAHDPTNIVRRCTSCHKTKTAREARARAARRRPQLAITKPGDAAAALPHCPVCGPGFPPARCPNHVGPGGLAEPIPAAGGPAGCGWGTLRELGIRA